MLKPQLGLLVTFTLATLPSGRCSGIMKVIHPAKRPVVATYWEEETVTTGAYGFKQIVYYTKPSGPVVIGSLKNNRFHMIGFKTSANGVRWEYLKPGVMGPSYPDILKRLQLLVKMLGLKAVERMADWPVGRPGFFLPRTNKIAPPRYFAGQTLRATSGLKLEKIVNFRGHRCEVLAAKPISLGSNGTDQHFFYWDPRTGFMWRADDVRIPPAGGVDPPTRTSGYIAFKRRVIRIPPEYLRFPRGIRYILPTCMGPISPPQGGTEEKLPAAAAFLGFSLNLRIINRATLRISPNKSASRNVPTVHSKRKLKKSNARRNPLSNGFNLRLSQIQSRSSSKTRAIYHCDSSSPQYLNAADSQGLRQLTYED